MTHSLAARLFGASVLAAAALAVPAGAQTLRIGLAEDPDGLDPTTARTFVGRSWRRRMPGAPTARS